MRTQIYLFGEDVSRAQDWLKFNASWYDAANDELLVIEPTSSGLVVRRPSNVEGVLNFGTPIELGSIEAFDERRASAVADSERDLVLAPFNSAVQAGWRETIARARSFENVLAATGRWIVAPRGLAISREIATVELADAMPARIANAVREWSFSPEMHGVRLARIPLGFIWVSPSEARRFLTSIALCQDIDEGVMTYFEHAENADGAAVYLPDLMVYDTK